MKPKLLACLAALATSGAALTSIQPAQAQTSGETLFRQRCAMCHVAAPNRANRLGPELKGVVGRKAASTQYNYSAALKRSRLTWTPANLDRYLAAPTRFVPGTRMIVSVPNAAHRAALIRYLRTMK